MIGKKVVHHMMMSEKDAHYVGGSLMEQESLFSGAM